MELARGGDLFEAISVRGSFSEDETAVMVADVSEALKYIHRRSVVHRDVKPENLLLADSRLKEEQATCPNCRCEISKNLCCRNLILER